ncbi:replication-associated recombination protein A [Candidatus Beckwithbacteria bacterium]|nr:replication-associated recombination protein A [Candidatus Beckwithbacteria bacterium]
MQKPLAEILRPQNLIDFIGQSHLVGEGKPLNLMVKNKKIHSMIFWGPPGCGKTTLARIIANSLKANLFALSAVSASKLDIKKIVEKIKTEDKDKVNILFLDEIHRFNKAQQDFLLPYVEDGTLILIGATTENPSFEVIGALLSRCRVYVLKPLTLEEIKTITERGINYLDLKMDKLAKDFLIGFANGDGRFILNTLQLIKDIKKDKQKIDLQFIKLVLQKKSLLYDKNADNHYDTISAFIKSMRSSNIDAALYYLARMIESGEDPKFIARRMIIFASEDIGIAVPTALVVANEVFRAVDTVGIPEAQINLAHGVVYLCQCKKNRSAYNAYFTALEDVRKYGNLSIPLKIRNAPTKLMQDLKYGENYEMYTKESLLPEELKNKKYFK